MDIYISQPNLHSNDVYVTVLNLFPMLETFNPRQCKAANHIKHQLEVEWNSF